MAILPIVELPDPLLRLVSQPVETVDDEVRRLIDDMIETMYDAHGIGLAAIQVGIDRRVVVIDLQEQEDADGKPICDPRAYVNPEILSVSDEIASYNEGCLSIPEQYADVARPSECRVRWLDRDGTAQEDNLDGLLSTCMQHEIDHLNGVLFIDHISRLKRDMLVKRLAKTRKAA